MTFLKPSANSTDWCEADMAAKPLKVGIIGAGNIARLGHIPGLRLAGADVSAICDANIQQARIVAEEFSIPNVFADYNDMLEKVSLDAVTVGIPNVLHAPATLAALKMGKHVLCEKPIATSYADAKAMVDEAKKQNKLLALNLHYRLRPEFQLLKGLMAEGQLGQVHYTSVRFLRRSGIPAYGSWFTRQELAGGGPLMDLGAHILDLALWLTDFPEVESVSAQTVSQHGPKRLGLGDWGVHQDKGTFDVEDFALIHMRLKRGGVINLETSWAYHGPDEWRVQLVGDEGGADVDAYKYGADKPLRLYRYLGESSTEFIPSLPQTQNIKSTLSSREWLESMRLFVETIRGNATIATGAEALESMRVLELAYQDAKRHQN